MAELIEHMRNLADEIGPRPATTDAEQRAAEHIEAVFTAHGLESEVQEFDAPRSTGWAWAVYAVLAIAAAVLAGLTSFLIWPAFAVAAIAGFFHWFDLDTRWGLTGLMPKGPSQNVIARHVPKARRGERLRTVVVVAHYDAPRAALEFSVGPLKNLDAITLVTKIVYVLLPVLILAMALPQTAAAEPWLWYATIAVSAWLLVSLVCGVYRSVSTPTDGANCNASGVAAMLTVMESVVPEPDAGTFATTAFPVVRRDERAAVEADVVPEGALLNYSPASSSREAELPDGFEWAEPGLDPTAEREAELPDGFEWAEPGLDPTAEVQRGQAALDFDTVEFEAVDATHDRLHPPAYERPAPAAPARERDEDAEEPREAGESSAQRAERERKRGLGGLLGGRKRGRDENGDVKGWLGVDESFDARKKGREIGSWDNFDDPNAEDDDGFGWKGGWAGEDPIGDPDFASEEAARIRRRVLERSDRDLTEKEVWFVATGAGESGSAGLKAFLDAYGDDLRDASFINIECVGQGTLSWVTEEGRARRYRADRRLTSLAKRVSREQEIMAKPRAFRGWWTEGTVLLARGYRAVTLMGFDADGGVPGARSTGDVSSEVEESAVQRAADLVTHMIREA